MAEAMMSFTFTKPCIHNHLHATQLGSNPSLKV
ncbi:hypothetical protein CCACVL1_20144, partial [Corchorus capsularis]